MQYFCTLFNSMYLDKGLVLYDSLVESGCDFTLYLLAMDDELNKALREEKLERVTLITLDEVMAFEPELERLKKERKGSAFYWTCSSVLIEYVLSHFSIDRCTYIDSDMYFYSDPSEMAGKCDLSVGVMKHRFPEGRYYRLLEAYSGTYCVEFNTFKNDGHGRKVLSDWKKSCLECCNELGDEKGFGDQKYLDGWDRTYPGKIYVYEDPGAGMATWNIKDYSLRDNRISYRGKEITPIFYHFSGIDYAEDNSVTIVADTADTALVRFLYEPYLEKLEEKRDYIKTKYGIDLRVSKRGGEPAVSEKDRDKFKADIIALVKKAHFIKAFRKISDRKFVSGYSHNLIKVKFDL